LTYLVPYGRHPSKGEEKNVKLTLFTYKSILIIEDYILGDVINLACFLNSKKKMGKMWFKTSFRKIFD
jgi:hypothetical protein